MSDAEAVTAPAPLPGDVLPRRLRSQLLTGDPATDPLAVVGRIAAVQAQDARGSLLAVRARSAGLTARDVDRCLTEDRSLVVDWLCRGTLHLVRSEDHAWLHALTAPRMLTASARRLQQEGVSPDAARRGIEVVEREVSAQGPRTRAELRSALDSAGVPTAGQALVHVIVAAALRGVCVRGPVVAGERAFVHAQDWLGPRPAVDRDVALGELARRYLVGHGPATERDLAYWSGLPLRDVRAGLRTAGAVATTDGSDQLVVPATPDSTGDLPAPKLLGMFDPVLHGWQSRSPVLGVHDSTNVVTSNGMFRATALVEGHAVATWSLSGGKVALTTLPGESIEPPTAAALDREATDVLRFLSNADVAPD
jgi:hypothetical protein